MLLEKMDFRLNPFSDTQVLDHLVENFLVNVQAFQFLDALDKCSDNGKGHSAQCPRTLVFVNPPIEIDLGHDIEPPFFVNIDQHARFHAVSDVEGDIFKNRTVPGIFTGQRL